MDLPLLKPKKGRQRGVAMLLTMVVMATLLLGSVFTMGTRIASIRGSAAALAGKRGYYCAEAGLTAGANFLRSNFATVNTYLCTAGALPGPVIVSDSAAVGGGATLTYQVTVVNDVDSFDTTAQPCNDSNNRVILVSTCTDPSLNEPVTLRRYFTNQPIQQGVTGPQLTGVNQIQNASFQNAGASGNTTTQTSAAPTSGTSAAANWTTSMNTAGTISTSLTPITNLSGYSTGITVTTNGPGNGLVQVFGTYNTGPIRVLAGAYLYVTSGTVGIGTGNGGNTGIDATVSTTGQWVYVSALNGVAPANEFIIYATSAGGASFMVAFADIETVPNLMLNPEFSNLGPAGTPTSYTGAAGTGGQSAAANWQTWISTDNTGITTELLPSTRSPGMMLHVVTTGASDGVYQVFCPTNYGPAGATAHAWIYPVRGTVGLSVGQDGTDMVVASSSGTGGWQEVTGTATNGPLDEVRVYTTSTGGGEFYIDGIDLR